MFFAYVITSNIAHLPAFLESVKDPLYQRNTTNGKKVPEIFLITVCRVIALPDIALDEGTRLALTV